MRIVVVTAATNTIPRFRIEMLESWIAKGVDVLVLGDETEDDWKEYFKTRGIRYRAYFVIRNGLNPFSDLKTLRELRRIFLEEMPDKIFTYQAKPNIYGCLAARKAHVPEAYVMMGGIGSTFNSNGIKNFLVKTIISAEYRRALKQANRVFFQNEEDISLFVESGIIDHEKTVLIRGSGVNIHNFSYVEPPKRLSFLYVGRLIRDKGVMEYLEASRIITERHKGVECHLVGPVDENPTSINYSDLNTYIDSASVFYHGGQDDVRSFLEKSSVFVLPSYREGTPKAALEAMSVGRPLIVSDAPGCREVVIHGENGYLVKPKNIQSLVSYMEYFILNPDRVLPMGQKSRELAENIFDVDKVNEQIWCVMKNQEEQ